MGFLDKLFGKKQSPELLTAAKRGEVEKVKAVLAEGANLETTDSLLGATPLQLAAQGGHKDIVKLLLDAGANVNASLPYTFC